ncbi:MAG: aminodeoxychorismate lyase [Rheinheimera sp.]|nr:aminodeoxychorismate lyase [Rheinheimera sp.]
MQSVIHPQDRSFNYGDGIFTTILVTGGKLQLWPLHLQRLQRGATVLGFGQIDWQSVQHQAQGAITQAEQVIKLLISRGEGGRGYAYDPQITPRIYVSSARVPDYQNARREGINLGVASLQLAVQPLLAGLKHNNRLEQVLIKQQLSGSGFDDLLVRDQLGFVIEASAANVLFYRAQRWYTPELSRAGVAGVMRQHIMQQADISEVNWTLDELQSVEAMAICNSLMGIVPVHTFTGRNLSLTPVMQLKKQVVC